jgi:F-type H+-transporting ATPase subunit delta
MAAENLKTEIIAETYASVMLELGVENDKCDVLREELEEAASLLGEEKELSSVLNSPFVPVKEKVSLIEKIFDGKVDRLVTGLMASMIRRGRLRFLKDAARVYDRMLDEHRGIQIINVTLASEVSDSERADIENKLADATGGKIKVVYHIDPDILGGIIIRHGGDYVDNSLRRILSDAKKKIMNKIKT